MGPTTVALLRFFRADHAFQQTRQKLDAATRSVRVQEGKVNQLTTDHTAAHKKAIETEAKANELALECKSREDRIELLRTRQASATNPKEYQALLVEINTQKTDKTKLEEQQLSLMEAGEQQKKNAAEIKGRVDTETTKLGQMKAEIDDKVSAISAELETLRGPRDEVGTTVPPAALALYKRMADRFEGEAMAAIEKPDPRDIEYLCTGCNTYLVANIYNRLMSSKDEIVTCPSCQRILYVPEDLTPEKALSMKTARGEKKPAAKKEPGEKKPRAPRKKKEAGAAAGGSAPEPGSVAAAIAAGSSAASGKGLKSIEPKANAPAPSLADGRSNVDLLEDGEAKSPDAEPTSDTTADATAGTTAGSTDEGAPKQDAPTNA